MRAPGVLTRLIWGTGGWCGPRRFAWEAVDVPRLSGVAIQNPKKRSFTATRRMPPTGRKRTEKGHAYVSVIRHSHTPDKAIVWLFSDNAQALPSLGRKLPHYGKYSYLAFEGERAKNVLKRQWTSDDSPLRIDLRSPSDHRLALPQLEGSGRTPLSP